VQDLVGLVLAVPRAVLVLLTVVVIVVEVHQRLEHLSDGILSVRLGFTGASNRQVNAVMSSFGNRHISRRHAR